MREPWNKWRQMARSAVFLDRDGVLLPDVFPPLDPAIIELYPCAAAAVARLQRAGFTTVVVTNQTGVARGMISEDDVASAHQRIQELLADGDGASIDRFYYCPHHPKANVLEYQKVCEFRKPSPGMLLQAAQDLDIDLASSYLIGDRISDIIAGKKVGCRTVQVQTGMHLESPVEGVTESDLEVRADHICANLSEAVDNILRSISR